MQLTIGGHMTEIGTRAKSRIGGRSEVNLEESGVNFGMFSHLIFLCIASLGLLFNCPVPVTHSQSQCAVVQRKNKSSSTNRIAVCTCYFRFFSTRRVFCLRSRIFFHTPSALCWLAGWPSIRHDDRRAATTTRKSSWNGHSLRLLLRNEKRMYKFLDEWDTETRNKVEWRDSSYI